MVFPYWKCDICGKAPFEFQTKLMDRYRVIECSKSFSISPQFLFILSVPLLFFFLFLWKLALFLYLLLREKMKCKLVWRSYGHSTPFFFQWCVPIDSWDRYGEKVKKKEKRSKTIHFSKSFGRKGLPNAIEKYSVV